MSATYRFHLFVSTLTVTIMFSVFVYILPRFGPINDLNHLYKLIIGFLGSVGTYKALTSGLLGLFDKFIFLRKRILGSQYIEGTWIGCYINPAGQKRFTIEYFEQTLDRVIIRGQAFTESGEPYGQWLSRAVTVDAEQGALIYAYDCDIHSSNTSFQGIAIFHFERENIRKPPTILNGFSADLVDGVRSANREYKISDTRIDMQEAFKKAKGRFASYGRTALP
jgi:hypothetical protein